MLSLPERVQAHIRRHDLLHPGDRAGIAVSGGIDSVALLRLLLALRAELGIVLSVVHFNHKLRGPESEADQQFVANLAREHDLEFHCDSDDVAQHAAEEQTSLEAAARELRYGFFHHLLGEARTVDKILTGHTLDDQAETVLMRLIRGSGLKGVAGIHPRLAVEDDNGELCGEILRPLLPFRRRELEQYLKDINQPWREDSTNTDHHFTRNRVRKLLVPLLENEFNPSVTENLSELAEIARGEEDYWQNELAGWMGTTVHWSEPDWARNARPLGDLIQISPANPLAPPEAHRVGTVASAVPRSEASDLASKIDNSPWLVMNASVSRMWFLAEPLAVQRRLIKAIGEHAGVPLEFKHVEEILRFAAEEGRAPKELILPLGWKIQRQPGELLFVTPDLRQSPEPRDYEYPLAVPGSTSITELSLTISALRIPANETARYNPDELLNADSLAGPLRLRNWRPGDRFWPAHTKSPRKIKELLQDLHVTQPMRGLWPVVICGDEIVWVRGFAPHACHQARTGSAAILIREEPADGSST